MPRKVADNRRLHHGLPKEATDVGNLAIIELSIDIYRQKTEWCTDILSEYFVDDFDIFTAAKSKTINSDSHRTLHDLLQSCGVHVLKGRSVLIGIDLTSCVQTDLNRIADELRDSGETTIPDADGLQQIYKN